MTAYGRQPVPGLASATYKRQGPHLNDYRYLSDEGQGGGIETSASAPVNCRRLHRQIDPANALISQTNHDLRYEGTASQSKR